MAPDRVASISISSQSAKSTAMCGTLGPLLRDQAPEDRQTRAWALGLAEDETILPPDAVPKEVPVPGLLVEAVSDIQGEQVVLKVDSLGLKSPKIVAGQQGGRGGGRGGGQSSIFLLPWEGGGLAQGLGGWLCWPVAAPIGLSPLNLLL